MPSTLDVVNECLATMGEAPLSALTEYHVYRDSAQRYLSKADKAIQGQGWWYNTEEIVLTPHALSGHFYLGSDAIKVETGYRSIKDGRQYAHNPRYVQRGSRMYDLYDRTYSLSETQLNVQVVRKVKFEDVPQTVNDLIAAEAVLKFQSSYDGDNNRRQELTQAWKLAGAYAKAEDTRQRRVNLLDINPTLARIKRVHIR